MTEEKIERMTNYISLNLGYKPGTTYEEIYDMTVGDTATQYKILWLMKAWFLKERLNQEEPELRTRAHDFGVPYKG